MKRLSLSLVSSFSFMCATILLTSCGQMTPDTVEGGSDVLGVQGTGPHEICATDVNVRTPGNLSQIMFTAGSGEAVTPTGAKTTFMNKDFREVSFKASGKKGYVANDYICVAGTVATGAPKIVVNLKDNILRFYRGDKLVRSWNVGTARAGHTTPTGNFKVKIKEKCPPYYGADGSKNIAGCTSQNPLGTRALWFIDTMYGLHGTSQPELLRDGTTADQRRLSAGCIRNANDKIEWLYDQVAVGTSIQILPR